MRERPAAVASAVVDLGFAVPVPAVGHLVEEAVPADAVQLRGGHQAASRSAIAPASPKYPANCCISASASRFTWRRTFGLNCGDGRSVAGSAWAIRSFTCWQRPREPVVPEYVEARHHVDEIADVLDHRVAEDERLAVLALLQALRDALDRLAEAPVEVAHGVVQAFLDLALDVALDPRRCRRRRAAP